MNDRYNMDKWQLQWDKAREEGLLGTPEKLPKAKQCQKQEFAGYQQTTFSSDIRDIDSAYWNHIYRLSNHMGDAPDPLADEEEHDPAMIGNEPVTISEDAPVGNKNDFKLADTTKPDKKSVADVSDELGGLPNPVQYPSRGKDANNRVTPDFAGGQELIELHKMKEQLQKLEDKMAADPMVEKKGTKKIMAQIDALWKQIDKLSDTLSPDYVRDYLS